MSLNASETDRRVAAMIRVGTVTAVDPAGGRCRVNLGGSTQSAWIPFPSPRAGAIQIWAPPSVGEQVVVASPGGDTTQGLVVASLASGGAPAPSADGGAFVIEIGGSTVTITAAGVNMVSNGSVVDITAGGVAITGDVTITGALAVNGSGVTHNGTNIGDDHVHSGIVPGGANTLGPQ